MNTELISLNKKIPRHISIIMDGNGRWAKKRGFSRSMGHQEGLKTVKMAVKVCAELGVEVLSLFAFGCENWKRPDDEVNFLMELFVQALRDEVQELHEKSLRLRIIGDRTAFSPELQKCVQVAETLTEKNQGMQLILAINYSGRWDILQAMQKLGKGIQKNEFQPENMTQEHIQKALTTADLVEPDLFIRTSGEKRISNFFLWQMAYTEFVFIEENWPEFSEKQLLQAIDSFSRRERRYGKTSEQLSGTSYA